MSINNNNMANTVYTTGSNFSVGQKCITLNTSLDDVKQWVKEGNYEDDEFDEFDEWILEACFIGRFDIVQMLDATNGDRLYCCADIALGKAIDRGHVDIVKFIFEKHEHNVYLDWLLARAVKANHLDVLKYLLLQFEKSEYNCQYDLDEALFEACNCKNFDAILILLEAGADPDNEVYDDEYHDTSSRDLAIELDLAACPNAPPSKNGFF